MTSDAILQGRSGEQLVNKVASAFAIDPALAEPAVQGLVDALKFRIARNMLSRGGVADVTKLVTSTSTSGAVSPAPDLADPTVAASGNGILDVLIGNKHISRGIAASVASRSGLDAATVERILPAVATALINELGRQAQPALQKLVGDVPGLVGAGGSPLPLPGDTWPPSDSPAESPNTGMPSPTARGGNSSGGAIDAGGPLPLPGDSIPGTGRNRAPATPSDDEQNPYNRLPDIVRRGGGPSVPGGGSLEDVIRSIFGQLLGSNRGVIGTMIQLFVIRWIASLLRGVLGRAFGRQ